jgi:hypothetical protein
LKLKLGVIEVPEPGGLSSYELGKILEEKYTLFSSFVDIHHGDIEHELCEAVAGAFETFQATGHVAKQPFDSAGQQITKQLKEFIYKEELAGKVAGVPTQAALEGLSTRTMSGKTPRKVRKGQKFKRVKTGVRRPSFIDTGIFEASTKVWIE